MKFFALLFHIATSSASIHIPSGISTTASDERSQAMNKKAATERLKNKLLGLYVEKQNEQVREKWLEHHSLERGNAVNVFRETLD